jgi:hypothetical protein
LLKKYQNASIIWKEILSSFHLIDNWLVWRIGKGGEVLIGLDPWIDYNEAQKLTNHLMLEIKTRIIKL